LPALPATYWDLTHAVERADVGIAELAEIVEKDPAVAAKVLQIVNSAFFGLPQKTTSICRAVSYLGAEVLRALALTAHVFAGAEGSSKIAKLLNNLQDHSMRVARVVRHLVDDRRWGDDAFTAALVHDVGMIVLGANAPERVVALDRRIRDGGTTYHAAEKDLGGPTHAEVGAYLLGSWGLPFDLVEAVAFHHEPSAMAAETHNDVLFSVHLAEAFVEAWTAGNTDPYHGIDLPYVDRVGQLAAIPSLREKSDAALGEIPRSDRS
jgi:HD-like signal output (HDOD) protein